MKFFLLLAVCFPKHSHENNLKFVPFVNKFHVQRYTQIIHQHDQIIRLTSDIVCACSILNRIHFTLQMVMLSIDLSK